VDNDGKFSFSDLFTIHLPLNTKFTVYPNPVKNNLVLRLNYNTTSVMPLQITDLAGRVLINRKVVANNGLVTLNVNSLNIGTYIVKLAINDEVLTTKIVVEK
jgi:hypothetical protein